MCWAWEVHEKAEHLLSLAWRLSGRTFLGLFSADPYSLSSHRQLSKPLLSGHNGPQSFQGTSGPLGQTEEEVFVSAKQVLDPGIPTSDHLCGLGHISPLGTSVSSSGSNNRSRIISVCVCVCVCIKLKDIRLLSAYGRPAHSNQYHFDFFLFLRIHRTLE